MNIIDNFLDEEYFNFLNSEFLNNKFPWYFQKEKVFKNDENFQYTHIFFNDNKINSNHFNLIEPFIPLLNVKSLVKAKLNLTTKDNEIKQLQFHTDVDFDCNTAVFYLNTNNGETIFDTGKKIKSVANRIVIFPSILKHTGTTHTNTQYRMVLNLNYF